MSLPPQNECVGLDELNVTVVDDILCSVAGVVRYHAVNEPVCMYVPGTKEHAELDSALMQFNAKVHDVPVVIGDEEIRSGEACLQPKVFAFYKCLTKTALFFLCIRPIMVSLSRFDEMA